MHNKIILSFPEYHQPAWHLKRKKLVRNVPAIPQLFFEINVNSLMNRLFPEIKWAQRKDRLFVTIELADFENHKIELTPEGQLKFQ